MERTKNCRSLLSKSMSPFQSLLTTPQEVLSCSPSHVYTHEIAEPPAVGGVAIDLIKKCGTVERGPAIRFYISHFEIQRKWSALICVRSSYLAQGEQNKAFAPNHSHQVTAKSRLLAWRSLRVHPSSSRHVLLSGGNEVWEKLKMFIDQGKDNLHNMKIHKMDRREERGFIFPALCQMSEETHTKNSVGLTLLCAK